MSEAPPPLKLRRQQAVSVAPPYFSTFNECTEEWSHAAWVFPEYFPKTLIINAIQLTDTILNEIEPLTPPRGIKPLSYYYRIGEYVGKVYTQGGETPTDPLYTAESYVSYDHAMLEACYMAKDAVRSMLRHILYAEQLVGDAKVDQYVNTILEYGIFPNSENDHAPETGYRPPE